MDENNENNQESQNNEIINTEETKNEVKETTSTITQEVKKDNKDSSFKKEANAAKNFFTDFFKTPFTEMKKIVESPKSFFKVAIVVFVVWVVAELLGSIISIVRKYPYSSYSSIDMFIKNSFRDFLNVIWNTLTPAIIVALLAVIIYLLIKNKNKNYLTILITVITAKIPVVIASILSLLSINSGISKIIGSVASICSVFSTVLIYFAIKALYEESDDNKDEKTFLLTMTIYYAVLLIFKFFNIYL